MLKEKKYNLEPQTYYLYVLDSKEFFTSNIELAHKRADKGSEIKVIYGKSNG